MTQIPNLTGEGVAAMCSEIITFESCLELLRAVADVPAPSGTSSLTRGTPVREWFSTSGIGARGAELALDVARSGCAEVSFGSGGLRLLAHLDEVSYLVDGPALSPGLWPVAPYCYHLAEAPAPARVVRFQANGDWLITGHGEVLMQDGRHFFACHADLELAPGDRVCLASEVACDPHSGQVTGSLDNAAGVVAALLAIEVLSKAGVPFTLVLTDEEEGPSGAASQTISRGAARYFRGAPDAPLTVAIDIHGVSDADLTATDGHRVPWGASLAEFSSHGRGSVAPPQLYASVRDHLCARSNAITNDVRPNLGGYIPRSDDVVAMTHSNRVLILGYPGINRHFDRGLPTANVFDLMALARALVSLAVGVTSHRIEVDW